MLVDVADPRYGGAPDPDEERRRRWEPMSRRIVLPVAASIVCLMISPVTAPQLGFALVVVAIALSGWAVAVAVIARDGGSAGGRRAPHTDLDAEP